MSGGVLRVRSSADAVWLCVFDNGAEHRIAMTCDGTDWHAPAPPPGTRYGLRAEGPWDPASGRFFDPAKLLVDPYAVELDRPFTYDAALSEFGAETAPIVPRAIVLPSATTPANAGVQLGDTGKARPASSQEPAQLDPGLRRGGASAWKVDAPASTPPPPLFRPGGLIYEINVRGFTRLHPDIPPEQRGTIAALAHPAIVAHLQKLGVAAVELMPVTAAIDERHLPPLGLSNAWGYNPVVPMALDPRLAPGGPAELAATVAALRAAGIGVILDLVLNHTGESDRQGPILSMRGLGEALWYALAPDGSLINDTGCGNTLDFGQGAVRDLALGTLRRFAGLGVDGFRFDLAPIMARSPGFDAHAPIFAAIAADPLLSTRVMIAEPWDVGPGGYQLGAFPPTWLEWNDRWRDDIRRFWRGDGRAGDLATRLAGSPDLLPGAHSRQVHFCSAHDGFTLADLTAYRHRHNEANGEQNRDGHGENFSWNNGVEGPSDDPQVIAARAADARALLVTLFASKGTPLLTAGDESGRTQHGNNNAYAQDNPTTWFDWDGRDTALEDFAAALSALRRRGAFADPAWIDRADWLALDGTPLTPERWADAPGFELVLPHDAGTTRLRLDRTTRTATLTEDP